MGQYHQALENIVKCKEKLAMKEKPAEEEPPEENPPEKAPAAEKPVEEKKTSAN